MKHETPATIIAFPRSAGPMAVATSANVTSAQILFFTGVRIERHVDDLVGPQALPRSKRSAATPTRQRRRN